MPGLLPNNDIKQVCIVGAGGVGGYYGAKIASAFQMNPAAGRQVSFIARGKHLEAIRQKGITLKTPEQTINSRPAIATSDIRDIPAPDLVLLCTKSYDLAEAVKPIKTIVADYTIIMPLLNGIDIYERIRAILPEGIVLPACVYLGTHIESPGVISQNGGNGIILSGPDPGRPEYTGEGVRRFFRETGIGFDWQPSPYPAIWGKFIFIAAFGLVTAAYDRSLGEVMADTTLKQTATGIMQEIEAIARRKKIGLADDIVEKTLHKAFNFPFEPRTSYQRDVKAWPKPNESDLYGGAILRESAKLGLPAPHTQEVYSRILTMTGEMK